MMNKNINNATTEEVKEETTMTMKERIGNAFGDFKEGFKEGFADSMDKVGGYTLNLDKVMHHMNGAWVTLLVLSIADIFHCGFKKHMEKAWKYHPVGQFLLGLIVALLCVIAGVEKDEE